MKFMKYGPSGVTVIPSDADDLLPYRMNPNQTETATWWDPLESIWNDQPYADDPEFDEWFAGLTEIQQIAFPTHWLCCEVYNGGFHQYFTNSTGRHAPEAVLGFCNLRLGDIVAIVQMAINVFGPVFPRTKEERETFLATFDGIEESEWNPFHALDGEFYGAIEIPDAPPLLDDDRFTEALKELINAGA